MNNAQASETETQVAAPVIAIAAPPTAHEVVTDALAGLAKAGAKGESLRAGLIKLLWALNPLKPVKVEFSKVKAERKAQMESFRKADSLFRSALGRVYRALEDAGAEHKDRHSAGVSATGILSLRRSESLTMRPEGKRANRLSL